jgi:hypothetical protein
VNYGLSAVSCDGMRDARALLPSTRASKSRDGVELADSVGFTCSVLVLRVFC